MKQTSVLAVLLSCVTICAAAKCNLTGQWKNDLGSNMTIFAVSEKGQFSGAYLTAVSATNKTIVTSPLMGYQQLKDFPTFGFTVKWAFSSSITVFTGQCFVNGTGQLILQTTWLLRSESGDITDNWAQTRVGYNIFQQLPPKKP